MKWPWKKKEKGMSEEEKAQHKAAANNAALYAAFSPQNSNSNQAGAFGGKGGGFDISNSQKIAAYNLLMNSKDDS